MEAVAIAGVYHSRRKTAVSLRFAVEPYLFYDSLDMVNNALLRCDGCGQTGSPEHIARRLRRLEWATRYRPVHIQALLLGGVAPCEDTEFLYAPGGEFRGEAEVLLRAVGIDSGQPRHTVRDAEDAPPPIEAQIESGRPQKSAPTGAPAGKTAEDIHAEFQAAGFFLTHILECPLEPAENAGHSASALLREHLPPVAARIRRSLKPKRVIIVTEMPQEVVQDILALDLDCEVILNDGKPFALTPSVKEDDISRFRAVLDSRAMR